MSRDTPPRNISGRKPSSEFSSKISGPAPGKTMRSRGVTFSGSQLQLAHPESGVGLEKSGRFNSFNSAVDTSGEHGRVTMKTRVAVRDKNPHRFQVVPLRDAGKLQVAAENASRLTMPTPPTNYLLRSPSGKLSPYSQSRILHSSLSSQSLLAKENRRSEDMELNVNKSLTASESIALIASPSSLSSFNLYDQDKKTSVLSERDVNRERAWSVARMSESERRSSHKAATIRNLPSRGAIGESVYPSPPHTHTTSRSLHLKSRQNRNYPKFTSLANFQTLRIPQGNILPQLTGTSEKNEKVGKVDCLPPSPESHGLVNARSKKRHAIYTASLFLPDFEQLGYSEGTSCNPSHQPFQHPSFEEKSEHQRMPFQQDPDETMRQEFQELVVDLCDQDVSQPILHNPDAFKIGPWGTKEFPPFESPLHHSSPKALSTGLRLTRGLSFAKPSRIRPIELKTGNVVYPQIVLDLFVDIDKAIEEWNPPRAF